jgi:hypothetical protein
MSNLLLMGLVASTALVAMSVRVRRYFPGHLTLQATLAGRGLYFTRTPDGTWWAIRLRRRRCRLACWRPGDSGSEGTGVREPRRPLGPGPLAASDALDPYTR